MKAKSKLNEFLVLPAEFTPGKIGVVTVLYNSALVLEDFFASLDQQSYKNFLVYCVDNASQDGSAQMCTDRGDRYVVTHNAHNLGVAAGNNQGIRAAIRDGCEYVLFLNNDVVFGRELFQQLLNGMLSHQADMTTPLIYFHDQKNQVWCAGGGFNFAGNRIIHYGGDKFDTGQFNMDKRVQYTPTCCVMVRRSLFEWVGLMDERYFVYCDDTDWMLRAKQAGAALWFICSAKLWHKVSSLTGKDSDFTIRYAYRNLSYYFYKHMSRFRASVYRFVYLSFYRLCLLVPARREKARLCLRSLQEGHVMYRNAIKSVVETERRLQYANRHAAARPVEKEHAQR
jgi:GT2 family glycosyltransferase